MSDIPGQPGSPAVLPGVFSQLPGSCLIGVSHFPDSGPGVLLSSFPGSPWPLLIPSLGCDVSGSAEPALVSHLARPADGPPFRVVWSWGIRIRFAVERPRSRARRGVFLLYFLLLGRFSKKFQKDPAPPALLKDTAVSRKGFPCPLGLLNKSRVPRSPGNEI